MNTVIIGTLGFILTLLILYIALRVKKLPIKETLALNEPRYKGLFFFLGIYFLVIGIEELTLYKLGLLETGQWIGYTNIEIIFRTISICLFAPFTEEIVFRGLLFTRLKEKFGLITAILAPALLFTLLHLKFEDTANNILLIITFTDAIFYGFARHKTNSVFVPIALHMLSNLIAVVERLI